MDQTCEERMRDVRSLAEPLLKVSGMAVESLIEKKRSMGGEQLILFVLTTRQLVVCIHIDFKSKIVYKGKCYDDEMLKLLGKSIIPEDKAITANDDMAIDDVMIAIKDFFFKRH